VKLKLPKINEIVVGKEMVTSHMAVSREMLELRTNHTDHAVHMADIEEMQDRIMGQLIYTLRIYLLKSLHNEIKWVHIKVPNTWWDHLKHDFATPINPGWKRWVVACLPPPKYRMESKSVETLVRLCPHNDSYLSEKPEQHFYFLTQEDEHEKT
jgi:hypothetical protein